MSGNLRVLAAEEPVAQVGADGGNPSFERVASLLLAVGGRRLAACWATVQVFLIPRNWRVKSSARATRMIVLWPRVRRLPKSSSAKTVTSRSIPIRSGSASSAQKNSSNPARRRDRVFWQRASFGGTPWP